MGVCVSNKRGTAGSGRAVASAPGGAYRRRDPRARAVLSLGLLAAALSPSDSERVFDTLLQGEGRSFPLAIELIAKASLWNWIKPGAGDSILLNTNHQWLDYRSYARGRCRSRISSWSAPSSRARITCSRCTRGAASSNRWATRRRQHPGRIRPLHPRRPGEMVEADARSGDQRRVIRCALALRGVRHGAWVKLSTRKSSITATRGRRCRIWGYMASIGTSSVQ